MTGQWQRRPGQSTRKARLPANWTALVQLTKERAGGWCQGRWLDGSPCGSPGTDCDHIVAGDNHDPSNLQWLCAWHHKAKTNKEARDARGPNEGRHPRRR